MDKKSKLLIAIFVSVILISIFFTYKRSFLDRNFIILEGEELVEEASENTESAEPEEVLEESI